MEKYNITEILERALEIEEAGQKFYEMLASRLEDLQLKKIFSIMSREEAGHTEIYKKMREELSAASAGKDAETEPFDVKKNEMLKDRIFNRLDVVRKAPKIHALGDALAYIIDIEIDGVDYFENIRRLVRPQDQPMMNRIINEEKAHVKQLIDLRTQFKTARLR